MKKYVQPVHFPKCHSCESNILPTEKYYFAAIDGEDINDVKIVHRECYVRNQTHFAREQFEEENGK